jgi:hypothetical protein
MENSEATSPSSELVGMPEVTATMPSVEVAGPAGTQVVSTDESSESEIPSQPQFRNVSKMLDFGVLF